MAEPQRAQMATRRTPMTESTRRTPMTESTRRMAKLTSHKSSLPATRRTQMAKSTRRVANGESRSTNGRAANGESQMAESANTNGRVANGDATSRKWPSRKWRVDERKWPSRPSLQLECDQLKASFRERSNESVSADTGKQTWRRPRSRVEAN